VETPRLAVTPISLECVPVREIPIGEGSGSATLVLGEVMHIYVADSLIDNRFRIDPRMLRPIGRLAGSAYCFVRDVFELARPRYHGER